MRIFISYRRRDAAGHAGRLLDSLQQRFPHPVFMDVKELKGGEEFGSVLKDEIERADVLIALIGPSWLGAGGKGQRSRIERPDDYVRREIETALGAGVEIVPVLVWGASMPSARSIPKTILALCQRQAVELTDRRWSTDVTTLIETLRRLMWNRESQRDRQTTGKARVVAELDLAENIHPDNPDTTGALLALDRCLLLASARRRSLWFIEWRGDEKRVTGRARLRRWPLWRPVAAAAGLGYLWVADARGRCVWRMRPLPGISLVTSGSDETGWTESIEYGKPTLGSVKGGWLGARPSAIAVGAPRPGEAGVWVLVPAPWPRQRGRGGELLQLDAETLKIVSRISVPQPRCLSTGAGAVWVLGADLLLKVDVARNTVAQTVPLGFKPSALTVGADTIWVGGEQEVARIDAITCHVEGRIRTPTLFVTCLALSGNDLWVGSLDTVHRINTRTHDLIESIKVSPEWRGNIRDIAADEVNVYAAVCNILPRSFIAVIDPDPHR